LPISVMTPVLTYAIENVGWQNTLLGFAGVFTLVIVPTALFVIRDDAPPHTDLLPEQIAALSAAPATPSSPLKIRQAIRTSTFWKTVLGLFTCGFSMNQIGRASCSET